MKNLLACLCIFTGFASVAVAESPVEPPVPVRTVPPEYPDALRREGLSGIVVVKCAVDAQGNVSDAQVEKSSNAGFEKPAVEAVRKWKFKPAKKDGAAVGITVTIPVKFVSET
jgi:periplasmic protein TonB